MAYTLNQRVGGDRLDKVQRGLLAGLPALALILFIGAILHHNPANRTGSGNGAQTIPIVSLKTSSPGQSSTNPASNGSSAGLAASTAAPAGGSSNIISTPPASAGGGSGGSGGIVGGRGGGPTGGGGSTGGVVTIPDCSLNQIATVNCQVPACSPPLILSPGQKAIAGVGGACIVIN